MTEQERVMRKREHVRQRESIGKAGNLNLKGLQNIETREITT